MIYTNEAIKRKKSKRKKQRNVLIVIIYIILIPLLIYNIMLVVQVAINAERTPSIFGIKTYVIISESMEPELQVGDIIIVKEQDEYEENDIISFKENDSIITHRITEKVEVDGKIQYKTKGDNNNAEDSEAITTDMIEGEVTKVIPKVGYIVLLLENRKTIIFLAVILLIHILYSKRLEKRKIERREKRLAYGKKQ